MNPVYFGTRFRVSSTMVGWPKEFAILSAFATTGEVWSPEKNAEADRRLEAELRARGKWMIRVEAYSPCTGHAEPSWAVMMPFHDACDIGERYLQDAIYFVRDGVLTVSYCDRRRASVPIGPFASRVDLTPPAGAIRIPYVAESFPSTRGLNGSGELVVTWHDILWAAATVGRPAVYHVFKHGVSSFYEALFRWSLVRMALEQRGSAGFRLRRTSAALALDPTEKGAVNYFLGLAFCKLFAAKLLDAPWLLHLDVWRHTLSAVLTQRSRPDLVGEDSAGRWHAFECKGRVSPPGSATKAKAKAQARRISTVKGAPCALHIAAITYFRGNVLNFYWCDPPGSTKARLEVPFTGEAWQYYYGPILQVLETHQTANREGGERGLVAVEGADLYVGVHPEIEAHLRNRRWELAVGEARTAKTALLEAGYQPDGIKIVAGPSWSRPFTA